MRKEKTIGWLLIAGAVGVLIPYSILTIIFDYPDILRQNTSIILTKFHEGGNELIWTWFSCMGYGWLYWKYTLAGLAYHSRCCVH